MPKKSLSLCAQYYKFLKIYIPENLWLILKYVELQSLIIGEKSSVRYVMYQNEEEDQ